MPTPQFTELRDVEDKNENEDGTLLTRLWRLWNRCGADKGHLQGIIKECRDEVSVQDGLEETSRVLPGTFIDNKEFV